MCTIFVKGFDFGTDEDALRKHFGAVGSIKELNLQSKYTATITYEKESEASKAVETLHETTMEGQSRYVALKMDDPDRERKGKGEGKGKGSGKSGSNAPGRTVFIHGFDFDTDEAAVTAHFSPMGAIETLYFQSKGSAVITFEKEAAAQKTLAELDGSYIKGQERYVAVKLDDPDRERKGKGKGEGKGSSKGGKGKGKSDRPPVHESGKGKGKGKGKDKGKGKGKWVEK